uniref:Uncharacterized protein n=1 Tax=Amphimedon queenslandica TaxID=400682 RepID=A0A1X7USS1_AMPQE
GQKEQDGGNFNVTNSWIEFLTVR